MLRLVFADTPEPRHNRPPKSTPRPGRKHVKPEEFRRMCDAARSHRYGLRDVLLITLTYRHGLRISEAVAVRWTDVELDPKEATIFIRRRKHGRSGTHTLAAEEAAMLRDVARAQAPRPSPFVFTTRRGTPLTIRTARHVITTAARAAGVPASWPHALRHGAGYRLIRRGTDLRRIQTFLGHVDIKNTEKYTALDPDAVAGLESD